MSKPDLERKWMYRPQGGQPKAPTHETTRMPALQAGWKFAAGGRAAENQQTWNFNTEEESRKPKTRKEQRKVAKLKANANKLSHGILTKSDLENVYEEDLEFIVNHLEQVWMENEKDDAVESKYLYRWEDLTVTQQYVALKKAVEAYDSHQELGSGHRHDRCRVRGSQGHVASPGSHRGVPGLHRGERCKNKRWCPARKGAIGTARLPR